MEQFSNTELILKANDREFSAKLEWDASIETLLDTFYGLCVTATYSPTSILANMKDFSESKLETFKQ